MRTYIRCGNPKNRVDICLGTDKNATSAGTAFEAYSNGNWNFWNNRKIISSGQNPSTYGTTGYTSYIEWGHATAGTWVFTVTNITSNFGYPVYTYAQECIRYYCSRCTHYEDRYETDAINRSDRNWYN